jgi:ferritin-like metal-binding protein YciE
MPSSNSQAEQKIVQYLNEAHATEQALTRVLQSQIAMTPRGRYRQMLETHLQETREHSRGVQGRLRELRSGGNPLAFGVGLVQSVLGQALALGKTPLDLLRGSGGEEKVLKNAKDTAATEALEIATYTAIIRLARGVGDRRTRELAEWILEDEQRMLDRVLAEIPRLTAAVIGADVQGDPSYDLGETGTADVLRNAGETSKRAARKAGASAKRGARQARRVPGVARAEGTVKGAVATAQDLPIPGYEELTAEEIVARLPELSQVDLAKVDAYERRGANRATVKSRISSLRGEEPWPGYDEQNVEEIRRALGEADESLAARVRQYERAHKDRAGVREASERQTANA